MSCYPTPFWEVKHANLGGVFDGNIGTDPQCLCHVLHPGGHRFRQSLPGTDTYLLGIEYFIKGYLQENCYKLGMS